MDTPVNFYKGTKSQIESISDASKSEFNLYFSNSPSYDIYSFDESKKLISYTLNITGSGPAINSYDPDSKTLSRRNLTAADISTGLGYSPIKLSDLTWTWKFGTDKSLNASLGNSTEYINIPSVPAASVLQSGVVDTSTQSFVGDKTFMEDVTVQGTLFLDEIKTNMNSDFYLCSNIQPNSKINIGNMIDTSFNPGWIRSDGKYYSGTSNSTYSLTVFTGTSYSGDELSNITSNISSTPANVGVLKVWYGTIHEYNSIPVKDPTTIYFCEE